MMKLIRNLICIFCISVSLMAWAESGGLTAKSEIKNVKKSVYKYSGSTQCSKDSGLSLDEMKKQLVKVQVNVFAAYCGNDGKAHITMCGGPDGKIGIFEISADQFNTAIKAGFLPIENLKDLVKVPCK